MSKFSVSASATVSWTDYDGLLMPEPETVVFADGMHGTLGKGPDEPPQLQKVVAADAVSIDVVNMPEAGRAGVEFAFLVRALDKFGNVDEKFEREVTLDSDDAPPGMVLDNEGRVRLVRGIGRSKCTLPAGGSEK